MKDVAVSFISFFYISIPFSLSMELACPFFFFFFSIFFFFFSFPSPLFASVTSKALDEAASQPD